ncbi:MAG: CHAD domain-containing protein, partial [Gammaproteobacteria bacterium]|nr:CHAD domain-containing protein [Gammaproteobacteria bacterium]
GELGCTVQEGPTQSIVDRYFDTADWLILRAGWAYRCRQKNQRESLNLKALSSGGGPVFVREEIEQPLSEDRQPGGELPPGPVQAHLDPIVNGHTRHELFSVRNRRSLYDIAAPDDAATSIELAVDRTEITAEKGRFCSFLELELEFNGGDSNTVTELAHALSERVGLATARLSKFERGLQVAGIEVPERPPVTPPPAFNRESPMLELAYGLLGRQLGVLKLHHPLAWEGIDPEGVHQMRIAIRRERAALRVFRPLLPTESVAQFGGELRWLARALGSVRDADVYDENFHKYLSAIPQDDARTLACYERHLKTVRREARAGLLDVLGSDRYQRLIADLEGFLAAG